MEEEKKEEITKSENQIEEYKGIKIVYEDNHILVVVKPQNIPSQGDETGDPDMLTILKEYLKEKYGKEGDAFLGLVHRLDRVTGGVMVFAKTSKAAERLFDSMTEGDFEKKYMAVVNGTPKEKQNRLTHYLIKNEKRNIVQVAPMTSEGAKLAELDYKVLSEKNGLSLVMIRLLTGRSHQARVQMATIGTPILGDTKYGKEEKFPGIILFGRIYPECHLFF
jgi:23S rRNA pseudouridine1911/1915/1917 synthase